MGNVSYIRRDGRLIEVETIEFGGPAKKRKGEPFLLLTHRDAVRGFLAAKSSEGALVWYALLYRVWAKKSKTIRIPTKLLRSWGLSRWSWSRALVRFEQAGLIRIEERRKGGAAKVTLLPPQLKKDGAGVHR
jgi:hypothetical protein